jgi:hypothetical protein
MTTTQTKPSALDALKGLAKKAAPPSSAIAAQVNDPAIAGAKRDKNTVKLGFDPTIAQTAERAANLKEALERAEAEFKVDQAQMRDYGIGKRGLYNDTFKCEVTTVCVPYLVDVPGGVQETKYVQVICSSKYSVNKDIILGNREAFGGSFDRLFKVETTKSLKPNAEELIRGVFAEIGLQGEDLEGAIAQLFETTEKVSVAEGFERESKTLPAEVRVILDQSVTKAQPALKFP